MNSELKGLCNGAASKSECARVKVNPANVQTLTLPVTKNGFALLGYKTGAIELYENTYVVFDFDGYVDYECEYVCKMKEYTMCVGSGSHGMHVYFCIEGRHDLSKCMDREITDELKKMLGGSNVVHLDVLTQEKVFAPGTRFSAHLQGYEILGTDQIAKVSLDTFENYLKAYLKVPETDLKVDICKEFDMLKEEVGDIFDLKGVENMRQAYKDMMSGKYVIKHNGKVEYQEWKQLYREFYACTGTDPEVLSKHFADHEDIQPSYQPLETTTQLGYIMHDKTWGKRVSKSTYEKYFPEYVEEKMDKNELKKEELREKVEAGKEYKTENEFTVMIDPSNTLILNRKGMFGEKKVVVDGEEFYIRSARYQWDSFQFTHYIVQYQTDDIENLYTFNLNGIDYHNKNFNEIIAILQKCYVSDNRQSINGILNGYIYKIQREKVIPDLTKTLRSYCGFHEEGWVLPQFNNSIITEESVGKQIKESLMEIDLDQGIQESKQRFINLYTACGWDDTVKDIVFSWYTVSPFLDAMRKRDTKLVPILSLFADGDMGKSTLTEKLILAWGHMDGLLAANEAGSKSRFNGMLASSTFPIGIDDVQSFSPEHIDDLKSATTIAGKMRRKGAGKGGQYETVRRDFVAPLNLNQNKYSNIFNDPQLRQRIIDLQITSLKKSVDWNTAARNIKKGDLLKVVYAHTKDWDVENLMRIFDKTTLEIGLERDKKLFCLLSVGKKLFEEIFGIELDFSESDVEAIVKTTRMINTSDITDIVYEYCRYALPKNLYKWQENQCITDDFFKPEFPRPSWVKSPIGIRKDLHGDFWYCIMSQNVGEILDKYGEKEKTSLQNFYVKIKEGFFKDDIYYDGKPCKMFDISNPTKMSGQAKCIWIKVPEKMEEEEKYPEKVEEYDAHQLAREMNQKGGRF